MVFGHICAKVFHNTYRSIDKDARGMTKYFLSKTTMTLTLDVQC